MLCLNGCTTNAVEVEKKRLTLEKSNWINGKKKSYCESKKDAMALFFVENELILRGGGRKIDHWKVVGIKEKEWKINRNHRNNLEIFYKESS